MISLFSLSRKAGLGLFAPDRKTYEAHDDLNQSGARRGKPHMEQRYRRLPAHDKGHRDPYKEGTCDPLHHYESGVFHAVKEAYEAEQEASQKTVDSISL